MAAVTYVGHARYTPWRGKRWSQNTSNIKDYLNKAQCKNVTVLIVLVCSFLHGTQCAVFLPYYAIYYYMYYAIHCVHSVLCFSPTMQTVKWRRCVICFRLRLLSNSLVVSVMGAQYQPLP